MNRGDFYATTGIILEDAYEVTAASVRIGLSDRTHDLGWSLPGANPELYRTEFIGKGGQLLKLDKSLTRLRIHRPGALRPCSRHQLRRAGGLDPTGVPQATQVRTEVTMK